MNNSPKIRLPRIGLTVTFKCNLKCRLCGMQVPYYENPQHLEYDMLNKVIKRFFDIIDYVENFEISGGETLLYPQLAQIIESVMKYKEKFNTVTIYTNGTIIPKEDVLSIMNKHNDVCTLFISNYGELSKKTDELERWCKESNIKYKIKKYYGEDLHCGGWVDFGDFYTETQSYKDCVYLKGEFCAQIRSGEIHMCGRSYRAMELGAIEKDKGEYLNLLDEKYCKEEAKNKLDKLLKKQVLSACLFCNGLCSDSKRFIPAEQL